MRILNTYRYIPGKLQIENRVKSGLPGMVKGAFRSNLELWDDLPGYTATDDRARFRVMQILDGFTCSY